MPRKNRSPRDPMPPSRRCTNCETRIDSNVDEVCARCERQAIARLTSVEASCLAHNLFVLTRHGCFIGLGVYTSGDSAVVSLTPRTINRSLHGIRRGME